MGMNSNGKTDWEKEKEKLDRDIEEWEEMIRELGKRINYDNFFDLPD